MSFTSLNSPRSKQSVWPETCPLALSILCDRCNPRDQRHVMHLSRFSLIETPTVARDMSFSSLDSLWSKQSMWPETCPSPHSILCDRSDHCGQWHVLHLSLFSVIDAIIVIRAMSFNSLDSLWSQRSLLPETCPSPLSMLCDRSNHYDQRHVLHLSRCSAL